MRYTAPVLLMLVALSAAKKCGTVANRMPLPPNVVCAAEGPLASPAVIKAYPKQTSQYGIPCLTHCYANADCKAVSVVTSGGLVTDCTLYSKSVTDMKPNGTDQTGPSYFDINCFKCITCNPKTQFPQVIDGTFDDSSTSIAPWTYSSPSGAQYSLVPSQPDFGNAFSVFLTAPSTGTVYAYLSQKIPVCAKGGYFTISFDYQFGFADDSSAFPSTIQFQYPGGSASIGNPGSNTWQTYTNNVFWDPSSSYVSFNMTASEGQQQAFYLDTVRILSDTSDRAELDGFFS